MLCRILTAEALTGGIKIYGLDPAVLFYLSKNGQYSIRPFKAALAMISPMFQKMVVDKEGHI
jgi:hypothetical protein